MIKEYEKYDIYDLYFRAPLWGLGFVSISFLVPGIMFLDKSFLILGCMCIWGVGTVYDLMKDFKSLTKPSFILIILCIGINSITLLYEVKLFLWSFVLIFFWGIFCGYFITQRNKAKKNNN